jgi:hypothetical protein
MLTALQISMHKQTGLMMTTTTMSIWMPANTWTMMNAWTMTITWMTSQNWLPLFDLLGIYLAIIEKKTLRGHWRVGWVSFPSKVCTITTNEISVDLEEEQSNDEDQDDSNFGNHFLTVPMVEHAMIPDGIVIEPYPSPLAGAPLAGGQSRSDYDDYEQQRGHEKVYAPFCSKLDWSIAQWAKLRGPSSNAVNDFLQIDGVRLTVFLNVLWHPTTSDRS